MRNGTGKPVTELGRSLTRSTVTASPSREPWVSPSLGVKFSYTRHVLVLPGTAPAADGTQSAAGDDDGEPEGGSDFLRGGDHAPGES
jgi:hypothetical protein